MFGFNANLVLININKRLANLSLQNKFMLGTLFRLAIMNAIALMLS